MATRAPRSNRLATMAPSSPPPAAGPAQGRPSWRRRWRLALRTLTATVPLVALAAALLAGGPDAPAWPWLPQAVRDDISAWRRAFEVYHVGLPIGSVLEERRSFLSKEECELVMLLSSERGMHASTVFTSGVSVMSPRRQSSQTWIPDTDHPLFADIAQRVAVWTGQPPENQENLQVVKYDTGGLYLPHYDGCVGDARNCEVMDAHAGPRLYTVLIYLNDDFTGGHTRFPWKWYAVTPEQGKAILFSNVHPTSRKVQIDSQHGGDPVLTGSKWIATKWVRPRRYQHDDTSAGAPAAVGQLPDVVETI